MIGAEISKDVIAKTGDYTIVLTANFHGSDLGASMNRRLNILATGLDPFDRFAQLHRNPTEQSLFRVNIQFRSKPTANFRCDDAQLVFPQTDHQGDLST